MGSHGRPAYRVIFFDMGGTLIDPHPSFEALCTGTFAAHGHPVSVEAVAAVQESLWQSMMPTAPPFTLSARQSEIFWMQYYTQLLERLHIPYSAGICQELYELFSSPATYKLYDDVLPVLDTLKAAGYTLGVISNWEDWLEPHLKEQGMDRYFDAVIISGVVGLEKPDPAIYRLALDAVKAPPETVVHVGDSLLLDVEPARAVGITPVLLDRKGRFADHAHPSITRLDELIAYLQL